MKVALIMAALVALGNTVSAKDSVKTKPVDAVFVDQQKKILSFFHNIAQVDTTSEYYKVGKQFNIEDNINNYTNKNCVKRFVAMFKANEFLPKHNVFSVFNEEMREQGIALFELLYSAKDFIIFYKTAAWAKINLNGGMFMYSFYIALMHREDTSKFIFPAPYETFPRLYINNHEYIAMSRIKQEGGIESSEFASEFGIVKNGKDFIICANNHANNLTHPNDENRLAYFMDDIGFISCFYYNQLMETFGRNPKNAVDFNTRRSRGDRFYMLYKQLLARYNLERLSNGLGEIPVFSWKGPINNHYYPLISIAEYPFAHRGNYYIVRSEKNLEKVRFLETFEKAFLKFLRKGHVKVFNKTIDLHDTEAFNCVGSLWQIKADLFGEATINNHHRSYETTAREVLGAAPKPVDKFNYIPSALDFYQTSPRDPVFYQLYKKIFDYMVKYYEKFVEPYNNSDLQFPGVKIQNVCVDKLVTYFELFDFEATNAVFFGKDDIKPYPKYIIRQPRLNHKVFNVKISVKSDKTVNASFKFFAGPKCDSKGSPISIEDNWMDFVELDFFTCKLVPGNNTIERKSEEFLHFREDALPISDVLKLLDEGKIPIANLCNLNAMPNSLMLPKGNTKGFPIQLFVIVYPHQLESEENNKFTDLPNDKPFGFPLDRPVKKKYFKRPNINFTDVKIYHEG